MRISFARISISPVFKFSLTAPERATTLPATAIQNSLRSRSAFAKLSLPQSASSKISCRMPERSRKSTKIIPPLFLLFCTQPITVTVSPIFAVVSSVQRWLLFKPFIVSAMFLSSLLSFYHLICIYFLKLSIALCLQGFHLALYILAHGLDGYHAA